MTQVAIGTKTIHMYGAYYPEAEGIVVDFDETNATIAVKDSDGEIFESVVAISSIRDDYFKPVGSPIGIYFDLF